MRCTFWNSSSEVSSMVPTARMAALLTSTSRRPKVARVVSITRFQSASLAMSWRMNRASPPISAAARWPASSLRSVSTTLAPSRASSLASSRPMPLAAPVTMHTLPSTRFIVVLPLLDQRGSSAQSTGFDCCNGREGQHRLGRLIPLR
ncbi:hypothetical protein D3C80_1290020 [compost metagenome]